MNKTPQSLLTKICVSCGQPKPLSAFLQLTAAGRSMYGDICSDCRQAKKNKSKLITDDTSGTNSTETIDSKSKTKADADKHLTREHIKELDLEEREKNELLKETRQTKIETTRENEQKHRDSFLNKNSLISTTTKISAEQINEQMSRSETEKKTVDYSKPIIDTQIAGKIKHHSATFTALQSWLGKSNPFVKNVEKLGLNTDKPQGPGKKR